MCESVWVWTADTDLIREVSLFRDVLYREVLLYFACHRLHQAYVSLYISRWDALL